MPKAGKDDAGLEVEEEDSEEGGVGEVGWVGVVGIEEEIDTELGAEEILEDVDDGRIDISGDDTSSRAAGFSISSPATEDGVEEGGTTSVRCATIGVVWYVLVSSEICLAWF